MGKIIWLASYPKSGNTWMRAFLHNYITQPAAPHSINALSDFSTSECNAAFFPKYDARPAEFYTTQEVQAMRRHVHEDLTRLHGDLVFVKTHNAALTIHDTPLCTPSVTQGAVFLVRDPRDVAVSYSAYTGRKLDEIIDYMGSPGAAIRSGGGQVFELLSSWSLHAQSWVGSANRLLVRYEDLLADPEKSFGRVIKFLGGAVEPARLRRAISFSDFKTLSEQEHRDGYAARGPDAIAPFFRKGGAGGWATVMTAAQARRVETDHGAVMKNFGYGKQAVLF